MLRLKPFMNWMHLFFRKMFAIRCAGRRADVHESFDKTVDICRSERDAHAEHSVRGGGALSGEPCGEFLCLVHHHCWTSERVTQSIRKQRDEHQAESRHNVEVQLNRPMESGSIDW